MASFFHISKMPLSERNLIVEKNKQPKGQIHMQSIIRSKVFMPNRTEESLDNDVKHIVANNYLKAKKLGKIKPRRRLKRPVLFENSYTNREVLQIPCFTFPK